MIKLREKHTIEYDNLFFCYAIALPSIVSLFTQMVRRIIGSTHSLDTLLIYGVFFIVFIKAIPMFRHVITKNDLVIVFFLSLAFLISSFYPNSDSKLIKEVVGEIFTNCILVYLGAKVVHESADLNKYLRITAYVVILKVIMNAFVFNAGYLGTKYSQYDGYTLLTGMGLLYVPLFSERKTYDYVIAGVTLLVTLLTGARGPFMFCIILLVVGMLLSNHGNRRSIIFYLIFLFAAFVIATYMETILLFISTKITGTVSTRIIDRLLNNEFFHDVWRERLFPYCIQYIKDHPFWGCGAVNERLILHRAFPGLGEPIGCYPHNFFLEVGMQFGFIPGLAIAIYVVRNVVKAYKRCFTVSEKLLIVALIGMGFMPLMVSASYLSYPMFFALMGFCNQTSNTFSTQNGQLDI